MSSRAPRFGFTLSLVTILHALVIGFLLVAGAKSCIATKPKPQALPIQADFVNVLIFLDN